MKKLDQLILVFGLMAVVTLSPAQQKTVKVKVVQDINGEKKIIEKEYGSLKELKADPELSDFDIDILEDHGVTVKSLKDGNVKVFIDREENSDSDKEVFFFEKKGDDFDSKAHFFRSGGDDFEVNAGDHKIKVERTAEGKIKIFKDGEEIQTFDSKEWSDKNGEAFHFDSDDHNGVFVFDTNGTANVETIFEEIDEEIKGGIKTERKFKIKVIMKKITIEDLSKDDALARKLDLSNKKLSVQDLNYYPNPNEGRFTLQFAANAKPTEVKVMDLNGRPVYNESLSDFAGQYNQEIDLSNNEAGVYILQVLQGTKALNKKIIIE